MPEKKPPRIYVVLENGVKIKRCYCSSRCANSLYFTRDDKIFYATTDSLGNKTNIKLPIIRKDDTVEMTIWRTPNGATVEITNKDIRIWAMDMNNENFPSIGDYSFELPTGYAFVGEDPPSIVQPHIYFKKDYLYLRIRKDLVRALYDMPNSQWVYPQSP